MNKFFLGFAICACLGVLASQANAEEKEKKKSWFERYLNEETFEKLQKTAEDKYNKATKRYGEFEKEYGETTKYLEEGHQKAKKARREAEDSYKELRE